MLQKILADQGNLTEDAARQKLEELRAQKLYLLDVY